LGGIVYGLIESSRLNLFQWTIGMSIGVGVIALVGFVVVEARVQSPMLPLQLFRSRNFTGANILTLLLYFSLSGALFFLTLNLIQVQGFPPTAAGAAFLPFVLIMFALSRWSGGLIARFGPRLPLLIGPSVAAAGFALLAIPGARAGYWFGFFPGVVVLGLGMAISVAPLTTTIMSSVEESHAGVASGINNAVARTAGLLAIAILGVVMLQVFSRELERRLTAIEIAARASIYEQRIKLAGLELPGNLNAKEREEVAQAVKESFVSGFRVIMALAAVMALASTFSTWVFIESKDD
jgi:hypothetical protein